MKNDAKEYIATELNKPRIAQLEKKTSKKEELIRQANEFKNRSEKEKEQILKRWWFFKMGTALVFIGFSLIGTFTGFL